MIDLLDPGFLPLLARDFDFGTVREFLFNPRIVRGAWRTLYISVLAQLIGIVLGVLTAVPRNLKIPVLGQLCGMYVWFFRGTPLLLQILVVFAGLPLYSPDDFGWGPFQYHHDWLILTPFQAGLIALAVNEGAYMSEIMRAGIESIEAGQMDAAKSLGMTRLQAMRHVVLPQALRVTIPPTGNEFNAMLKNSSLVSVIAYPELLFNARGIYAKNYQIMELLVVAGIWYLFFTTVWSFVQAEIEHALRPEQERGGVLARLQRTFALPDRWTRGGAP
jgi:polar amino acid transport system permease protein